MGQAVGWDPGRLHWGKLVGQQEGGPPIPAQITHQRASKKYHSSWALTYYVTDPSFTELLGSREGLGQSVMHSVTS